MFKLPRAAIGLFIVLVAAWTPTFAQTPAPSQAKLRVGLTCDTCDRAALQRELPFVELLDQTQSTTQADVTVVVTASKAESNVASIPDPVAWTVTVTGQGRFEGRGRTVEVPAHLGRFLRLLLAEYAAETDAGAHLDITFAPATPTPGAAGAAPPVVQHDPWNAWIFRVNANTFMNGEQSSTDRSYSYSVSATRTTDRWKLRLSAYRNQSKSSFDLDETTTITSKVSDWSASGLAVKSIGPRWSLGASSSVVGSSYSNSRRVMRFEPGVEFDWFPYAESSRRTLTFLYSVGVERYSYERLTIFDKLEETIGVHSLRSALGLRQPWGQVGASVRLLQQLTSPDRTRISVEANASVRLLKSLTLNASGNYSRLRDQFTLVKGNATDEEVLLRQRQLATGYRYSFSVGFGYAFGALSNTTVNPRFGGG
jgi:hypothetical protein